jgi:hypothetical protein
MFTSIVGLLIGESKKAKRSAEEASMDGLAFSFSIG